MEVSLPPAPVCWSNVVKKEAPPRVQRDLSADASRTVGSCNSSKGVAIAVVDANAIIQGSEMLHRSADKFVSVPEVMNEVRDPVSRHSLAFLPFTVEAMEPSPESLRKVIHFARATGDLQTLSDVDIKLIALTFTLEAQIHGIGHLRDTPPPTHTINVKRLSAKDPPGWGSNVPNLKEWEALENQIEDMSNSNSKILPLKNISANIVLADSHPGVQDFGLMENEGVGGGGNQEDLVSNSRKPFRYFPKKKEINIEGKKMVANGIDASQGEYGDDSGDWLPAVCRSTHRRFLRRKARREMSLKDEKKIPSEENNLLSERGESIDNTFEDEIASLSMDKLDIAGKSCLSVDLLSSDKLAIAIESSEDVDTLPLDKLDIDDNSSEQSWKMTPLSDSSVACVTSDFAMQNVILQMGLRLFAPEGKQIRQLHRWTLKCHACFAVTPEIGRIFCPECGNGGTLRKVSVTVGENGIVQSARRSRINIRGTKFSLPLPQGGRDAVTKNPVLREDQLPHKVLYPKSKKKANKLGEEVFCSDDIFSGQSAKKCPLRPPVGKAVSVYFGKRNPNDNHFSRARH